MELVTSTTVEIDVRGVAVGVAGAEDRLFVSEPPWLLDVIVVGGGVDVVRVARTCEEDVVVNDVIVGVLSFPPEVDDRAFAL